MASAAQPLVRLQAWCAFALGVVALNTLLAYGNLRRLEALPTVAATERSAIINRAIAFHAAAALCSVALLALAGQRILRERQVRQQLRELADQQRATLATLRDGVIGVDATGRVTFINDKAVKDAELSDIEAIGQPIGQVLPFVNLQTRLPADNPVLRAMRERRPVTISSPLALAREDHHTLLDATATPILSEDDSVAGAVLVVRDGSERAQAEKVLEASRSVFRAVLDALPTQVALLDRQGLIVETNAAWRQSAVATDGSGRPCGVGTSYPDACGEDTSDGEAIAAGIRSVIDGERPNFSTAHRCNGTPPLWLQMHVAVLDGQSPVRAVVAHEDVSERVQSESRMHRQSDQLRRLASVANLVNAAQDVRSVLGLVTAGACEIVDADLAATHVVVGGADGLELGAEARGGEGQPVTARSGQSTWGTAPCGSVTQTTSLTGAQLESDPAWRTFLQGCGYHDVPSGWMGAPLVGIDGKQLGMLHLLGRGSAFTDQDASIVTQLARLAAGAIENAWLYEELREGDRRKDEFLATLAHELRNPLAPMRSAIEIIRRADEGPPRQDAVAVLERQVLQMVRLIDDLLDISRITKGKLDLRLERLDLGAVIRHAVESSRPVIEAGEHELVLALPLEPIILRADHARLSQVFANLLNNAAKYSEPRGRIEVTLETSPRDAIVQIRDSGIGIEPEMLPRVFDMFVQEDQTLERARGGLGIGLTLVRSIVELHGGRVEASSLGTGQGSCFTVRLPRAVARGLTLPKLPKDSARARPTSGARRIMVVDDNADAVDSLAVLLGLEGHDVRIARDGPSAVAVAREFGPEVALLDIGLPGMSGYDVARALRADERTAGCLLVALTGWGQDADRKRSQDAGFDHHLVKPLDIDMLNGVLKQLKTHA
jgi:signal transduction histidine kinase/PAS domain-containing protein/ActR/RegA family two-component response regulator